MYWNDNLIKIMFAIGILMSTLFFGWVFVFSGDLNEVGVTSIDFEELSLKPGQLYFYPIVSLLIFVAAFFFAKELYNASPSIAYRVIVSGEFAQLILLAMFFWTTKHVF
ncbi:MAG: hypothetical protein GX020_08445 [Firmicutes bacterium]|jgi:hypothetical protein|nr:hypothetical protein [Bacillota bacterium]